MGWGGGGGGGVAHEILVSAQGPLVFGFRVWGLRVWGQGLTIAHSQIAMQGSWAAIKL